RPREPRRGPPPPTRAPARGGPAPHPRGAEGRAPPPLPRTTRGGAERRRAAGPPPPQWRRAPAGPKPRGRAGPAAGALVGLPSSSSLLSLALDEPGEVVELLVGQVGVGPVQQGRHGLVGGTVEERPHHPFQRRGPGRVGVDGGTVHVTG